MRLWKRASALLKDRNSIYLAKLSKKTSFRNPELEEAVIKATSHNDSSVDYKNAQRIFTWIRTSSKFLRPVIWALATRMEKTRYWVVALKGLMLMHGIFCCKVPAVRKIGRLPFDFRNFTDGYSNSPRTWGLSAFVRSYFAFLDQKSVFDAFEEEEGSKWREKSFMQTLQGLQKSQGLIDLLLQVKPYSDGWSDVLVLEAMDCIVIEIFDVYSRICNGIAGVLIRIYAATQEEAEIALNILHKATAQGAELDSYFEFCRHIGVLNASEFPRVDKIPDDDIRVLEQIIHGVSNKRNMDDFCIKEKESKTKKTLKEDQDSDVLLKTVVSDNWVVFEDEFKVDEERREAYVTVEDTNYADPFAASINVPPNDSNSLVLHTQQYYNPFQETAGYQTNVVLSPLK
ncbi:ENTH/ANTH/VHS superfamily protein [Thalictrum thalictroides]|uniref:ENTH/ANTH/VHS superfamily protein n=1 Tax=Thalictrum thalictroides TaxID=46969 RepID=A0A7J6XAT4_THATH|nr:ENTH/ANTH/VHS superfamily protein [Thalictrum thalictroides]